VFYTSGRASLETSYMYQLYARMYGSNHLPDCSNMCHESSSVALPASIGAAVGTAVLSDFDNCDLIFYIAQNVATSSPRMLHQLQDAVERGVKIITINPLRERGLERFTNPQAPEQMATGAETIISSQYMQVKNGGDIAALFGICKAVIAMDDAAQAGPSKVVGQDGTPSPDDSPSGVVFAAAMASADTKRVLDWEFIHEHTAGFEEFAAAARGHDWAELERVSGLTRDEMTTAAEAYVKSSATLGCYGMGLTQHVLGVENVHMVTNLLLLRGNIGKPGGNVCAVRGHSNVQGQRTVGITEKPELAPLDQLEKLYGFKAPRWTGHSTVDACKAIMDGGVRTYIGLGGNFLRAIPETAAMEAEPQSRRARGDCLPVAVPRPDREGRAGDGAAGRQHGKLGRPLPRQPWPGGPGQRGRALRGLDRRRNGESDAAAQPERALGRLGWRLRQRARRH